MANTKTAKENIKINERNRKRNLHYKTQLKSAIKRAKTAIVEKAEDRANIVFDTLQTIAKVAAKGIISKPTANRKKSSIHKALAKSLDGAGLPKRGESAKANTPKATSKKASTEKKADAKTASDTKEKKESKPATKKVTTSKAKTEKSESAAAKDVKETTKKDAKPKTAASAKKDK